MSAKIDDLLLKILKSDKGLSDLNLSVGRMPQVEVNGVLRDCKLAGEKPLSAANTESIADTIINGRKDLEENLALTGSCDCSYELPDGTRTRVNIFMVRGNCAIVMRALPTEIPKLGELNLPKTLAEIAELKNGLALVTGATGSGKSTTMAAIIDQVNRTRAVHIVTLEDPIEFLHPHKKGTFNQREFGTDFKSFPHALRAALRQAPKVIFVGEIRDRESMEIALKASETGHLVLSTLHTIDAGQTINRIVGMFDFDEERLVRSRLAQTLRFVVGQRLLPKKKGGRVAVQEIMGSDLRTQELIVNGESKERTFYDVIKTGRNKGWQTFDQHIAELLTKDAIEEEVAMAYASDPSVMRAELDQIRASRGKDTSDIGELEMLSKSLQKPKPRAGQSSESGAPRRRAGPTGPTGPTSGIRRRGPGGRL